MQDFGETLADIRERFEAPLPVRVRQTRVFVATLVEGLGILLNRDDSLSFGLRGLPDFGAELDEVMHQFEMLQRQPCTFEQAEQAKDAFSDIILRQQRRIELEHRLWINAVRGGMFLGHLTMSLLGMSLLMSVLTHHDAAFLPLALSIMLIQVIAGVICRFGWHYWR